MLADRNSFRWRSPIARISGFTGTETGGFVYDWWEKERPGQLKRLLTDHGVVMACLFEFGDWSDPLGAGALIESGRRWASGVKELGGDILMVVPGARRDEPPYGLDDFRQMAETMNRVGEVAKEQGATAAMHPHWGTMAESQLEIEVLLDHLEPELVGFAPDTGQIAKGGADPDRADRPLGGPREAFPFEGSFAALGRAAESRGVAARTRGIPRARSGYDRPPAAPADSRPDRLFRWLMAELDEAGRPAREAAELSRDYLRDELGLDIGREKGTRYG